MGHSGTSFSVEARPCVAEECTGIITFFLGEGVDQLETGQRASARCETCGRINILWRDGSRTLTEASA